MPDYLEQPDKPPLFLEGRTDKTVLAHYLPLAPGGMPDIELQAVKGGGYNWVADMLIAWVHLRKPQPAGALFDADRDALESKKRVSQQAKFDTHQQRKAKLFSYAVPTHIRELYQAGIQLPYALEELSPPAVWDHAQQQGWLEERLKWADIIPATREFDKSPLAQCQERGLTQDHIRYIRYCVKLADKPAFAQYVTALAPTDPSHLYFLQEVATPLARSLMAFFTPPGPPAPVGPATPANPS